MLRTRIAVLIVGLYLLGFLSHAAYVGKTVYSDGMFYFSWLRSVVVDHDISFADEYGHYAVKQPLTRSGQPGNKYSVGPALTWAPAYMWTHMLFRDDGYALPYQLAAGLTSVLATLFGLVLLYRLLPYGPETKSLTIFGIAFATNLFFYGSLDTVNSHALSFAAATVYLTFLLSPNRRWGLIGAALAMLAMMRLQDIVFALLLIPHLRRIHWPIFIAGFLAAFSPQLFAWYAVYGTLANPYLTGGEGFAFPPHIAGVLFNVQDGLFLWTPITLLALGGWMFQKRNGPFLAVLGAELLIVASWSTWMQGGSYSGRMFVSSLPLLAIGLAQVIERLRKNMKIVPLLYCLFSLSFLNGISIVYFLLMRQ
jgi:hypothetical protein